MFRQVFFPVGTPSSKGRGGRSDLELARFEDVALTTDQADDAESWHSDCGNQFALIAR